MIINRGICAGMTFALLALAGSATCATGLTAKWIWADVQQKTPFQQVAFQKKFRLSSKPSKAEVYITADTFYRLRVNGAFAMHGPARSSAGHATVDVVNIRPYLKAGENTLQCEAVYGDYVFEALAQAPGFLCEIRLENDGERSVIASDATWSTCELLAWDRKSPKYSFQRGWVEDIDGRKDSQLPWKPAVVLGEVGMEPWKTIELRDVPLPATLKDVHPLKVVDVMRARAYTPKTPDGTISFAQGSSVLPLTHWACRLETEKVDVDKSGATNPGGVTQGGHGDVILHGDNAEVVYDFGANHVGFISFEVTGKAGQVLEIAWNERLSVRDNVPRPGETDSSIMAMRYILRDGKQSFLMFTPHLARFVRVVNRGESDLALNSLSIKEYRFYAPKRGDFTCSEDSLNAIYESAHLTATLNTLDVFMDCPSRERGAWLHDSYWTAQAVYAMFGDISVNRRMCRQIAESQQDPHHVGPEGMVHLLYPSKIEDFPVVMPAHELFWVLQVGLDEQFTGDTSYTRRLLPAIRRMLTAFDGSCNSHGLLEVPFKWQTPQLSCWNFIDWANIKTDGVCVGLNAIYIVALDRAAAMERLAGDPARADEYSSRAARVRKTIEQYCPGDGYYPDSLVPNADGSLTPSKEMCETTQYYAMWSGIASEERTRKIWARLRDPFQPTPNSKVEPIDGLKRAGFYTFPERLEIAARLTDYTAFLRDIKLMCLPMAQSAPGTLWETPWANSSLCHGLGSMVAAMLTEKTLGIHLGLPIIISPRAMGDLKWCKGYITTPKGRVAVEWKISPDAFTLKAALPKGTSGQVILPVEAKRIWSLRAAATAWPDSVSVKGTASIAVTAGSVKIRMDSVP